MAADILDSPLQTGGEDDFDPASLDPAALLAAAAAADGSGGPPPGGTPLAPGQEAAAGEDDPISKALSQQITPTTPTEESPKTPTKSTEPVNMRKLRELREAAEKERDTFKAERDSLAEKLADIEPRAKGYETERTALEERLAQREKQAAEAQAEVWRSNARTRPEWQEIAGHIQGAGKEIEEILKLQEVVDSGLRVDPVTLLHPNGRAALNDTVRILNENGHYAEAQTLVNHHISVNKMRGELRRIEEDTAREAEQWRTNAEASEMQVIRAVKEDLVRANPVYDSRSAEFQAMSKENQDFMLEQMAAAERSARDTRSMVSKPEELIAREYRSNLGLRLTQHAMHGLSSELQVRTQEVAALRAKLTEYERAAGGGAVAGGGAGGKTTHVGEEDQDVLAEMLDPRNLSGYQGMGQ